MEEIEKKNKFNKRFKIKKQFKKWRSNWKKLNVLQIRIEEWN